jgi:hypothetical protein
MKLDIPQPAIKMKPAPHLQPASPSQPARHFETPLPETPRHDPPRGGENHPRGGRNKSE